MVQAKVLAELSKIIVFFTHKDALETIFLKSTLNSLVSETNAW